MAANRVRIAAIGFMDGVSIPRLKRSLASGLQRTKTTLTALQTVLVALLLAILTARSAFVAAEDPVDKGPPAGGAGTAAAATGGKTAAAATGAGGARPAGQATAADDNDELIGGAYAKPAKAGGDQGAAAAATKAAGAAGSTAAEHGTAKAAPLSEDAGEGTEPDAEPAYDGPEIVVHSSEEVGCLRDAVLRARACMAGLLGLPRALAAAPGAAECQGQGPPAWSSTH